jgi:hypothetical protein
MRILHRLSRLLVVALLLGAGVYLVATGLSPVRWDALALLIDTSRATGFWLGVGIVCLCVLYMFTGVPLRRHEQFLSFDNDGGTVSISTDAIAEYISKLMPEFPSIVHLHTQVLPLRNSVDLLLTVRVRSGSQVHEVCQLLQDRVRETMSNGLGITEVRKIEVSVREIVSEHRVR